MNVVCDGAGNLGLITISGDSLFLIRATESVYNMELLVDGQWSGGTTLMATFASEPEQFQWHDHEFGWMGSEWEISPAPEEWTE